MIPFVYQTLSKVGFNHPLHPAITHLPMGMAMGAFLFALASFVFKKDTLAQTAHHCISLALIFVLPTILLGYMDWQYKFDGEWSTLIQVKIVLAIVFCGLLITSFWIGKNKDTDILKRLIIYALCLINAVGLGFIGGMIQYG